MEIADSDRLQLLENLLLVRRFEEKVLDVYEDRGIRELPHSSLGQEAVGVGAVYPARDDDILVPSLRTRAVMLLRAPITKIVAGMYGTRSGPSQGRTTEHHMGSSEYGILGTTGMVGSHLNASAGAALGNTVLGNEKVTVSFLGDGATQRGELHTALNFSTVNELPVVFVIENNHWTEAKPIEKLVEVDDLVELGSHGLPTEIVDGQDVEAVVDTTATAIDRARSDDGPTLIEAKTYRYRPHAEAMPEHRDAETLSEWKDRDPVDLYRSKLLEDDIVDDETVSDMDSTVTEEVNRAFEFAENDELPDEDELYQVYKDTEMDYWQGVAR